MAIADFIVVSGESISMVSEAASSGKHTGVFKLKPRGLNFRARHELFLKNLQAQGYIHIMNVNTIADEIKYILQAGPVTKRLNDRLPVEEALKRLL